MNSLPIRVRLTVWYFAMFATAASVLCVASLWMLRRSVEETEYYDLQERAEDVEALLSHETPNRTLQQIGGDLEAIYRFKDDGKYLQVRDEQGNWIFRSKRMIAENPPLPAPGRLPKRGLIEGFHQGIHEVWTLEYPIVANGKRYSVQTGIALDKSNLLLSNFRAKLLLLTPIMILLAAAGGHAMSRKALQPVAALSTEARRINDRNLSIRLPVPQTRDEISDLSQTLNQMLERIEKAFASVRAFTGNASHEIRTPLTLLRTELEVALYRPRTEEEYRETLENLHKQTVRMTNLVDDLMSLARADAGAEIFERDALRLSVLLHRTRDTWKTTMHRSMLDFTVDLPNNDLIVLGDEAAVQRLLSILLENSNRYTPPGGSVRLFASLDGDGVRISVGDTGVGIAPEHINRIFDRFYRVDPDGRSTRNGSGLGLALAKWIAERHETELQVTSELGRGSCFSFRLELASHNPPGSNSGSMIHSKNLDKDFASEPWGTRRAPQED